MICAGSTSKRVTTNPIAAELSFGDADEDAGPGVKVVLDDGRSVVFRGSVDRVDRTPTGLLMVSDYKTGRQGRLSDLTRDPVAAGKLLQLPLYAMAALDRFGGPRPVHARYWLLSGERSAPCYHLLVTEEVEARFRQVVRTIADGVEDGCFPGVPGMPTFGTFSNCTGCAFDVVCPPSRDRHWGRTYNSAELRGVVSLVNGAVPDSLAGSVVKRFVDPDVPVVMSVEADLDARRRIAQELDTERDGGGRSRHRQDDGSGRTDPHTHPLGRVSPA